MVEKGYSIAKVSGKIYKDAIFQKILPPKKGKNRSEGEKRGIEPSSAQVDDLDLRIIKLLVNDSRTTLSSMAQDLGVGTSTIYKRLSKLVAEGVIKRFTILADGEKLGLGASAYVGLGCLKNYKEAVKLALLDISEIVEIHEVLEPYDLLIKVRSTDIKTLKEGPLNQLSELEGIELVKPILVLNTIKEVLYNV